MPKATKTASGKWRCQVFDGYTAEGKRIYKSITAKSKREAESAAALWIAEKEARREAEERDRARAAIPTLDEAIDSFIETCRAQNYSPATISGYLKIQRNSFPGLIDKKIDEITAGDIQMAVDARAADHSAKTVRNDYALIHAVLRRYRPDLSLTGIVLAKKRKQAKRVFSQAWAPEIIRWTKENLRTDFYIYTLFIICAGCRPSETYSLKWGDLSARPLIRLDSDGKQYRVGEITIDSAAVRGDDGEYHEKDPKTEAGTRTLTVDWSFFGELYHIVKRGADDDRILKMKPGSCPKYWAKMREHLGLPQTMRFYDLRHYYATQLSSAGASDEELAAAMGHTTAAMTHDVYIEIFEEDRRRVNRTVAAATANLFANANKTVANANETIEIGVQAAAQ